MKKLLIILTMSLAWCLQVHADDLFQGCVKRDSEYICSYTNPFTLNANVQKTCAMVVKMNDIKEMSLMRYKKYCNPIHEMAVDAKTLDEATTIAKQRIASGAVK